MQVQNLDYTIKYPEGRLMFNRPVSSVEEGGTLYSGVPLSGNPVYIQADYESVVESFEKTAPPARGCASSSATTWPSAGPTCRTTCRAAPTS